MSRPARLLDALAHYAPARQRFLDAIGRPTSDRDPLAELCEHLVAGLTGGTPATRPGERGWHVSLPDGSVVAVDWLANPVGEWVNEREVHSVPSVAWQCLVLLEDVEVVGVLMFPRNLTEIGAALHERREARTDRLLLTRCGWLAIQGDPGRFAGLGMRVWLQPELLAAGDSA